MASFLNSGSKKEKDEHKKEKNRAEAEQKVKRGGVGVVVAAAVLVAGAAVAQKLLRKRGKGGKQLINPCKLKAKRKATAEHPLADITLVVSPLLVQGQAGPVPADSTAPAVQLLVDAGIELVGTTSTEELLLGLQSQKSADFSAVMPESAATGTGAGIATAVAAGLADCGLGIDHMTGLKVHASMAGLFAYRASLGAVASSGTTPVAGSLDSLGLVAREPEILLRLGRTIQLPGANFHKAKLLRLTVAEDLFGLCDDATQTAKRAFKIASQRWPGRQYVQTTNLLPYLEKLVPSAKEFASGESSGSSAVLESIQAAATALSYREFVKHHSRQLSMCQDLADELSAQLDTCLEAADNNDVLRKASAVKSEVAMAMRDLLKDGTLYVMPALPGVQPSCSNPTEMEAFEAKVTQFGAIASLAGIPQVNIPVVIPGQGTLSMAIVGMGRSDMSLLSTASRLAPLVAAIATKLGQPAAKADSLAEQQPKPVTETSVTGEEASVEEAEPEDAVSEPDASMQAHPIDQLFSTGQSVRWDGVSQTGEGTTDEPAGNGGAAKPEEESAGPAAELAGKLPRESSGVVKLTANAGLPEGTA